MLAREVAAAGKGKRVADSARYGCQDRVEETLLQIKSLKTFWAQKGQLSIIDRSALQVFESYKEDEQGWKVICKDGDAEELNKVALDNVLALYERQAMV